MAVIIQFGKYSGLTINWSKSSVMLLDDTSGNTGTVHHNIPVSSRFKYLGIYVTPDRLEYVHLNLSPLLNRIRDKAKIWSRLKLSVSVVGKVNSIKIIFMPQFLYALHNTRMVIPLKMFCIINSLFGSLIWHSSPPRIKLEQLQRPKEGGGLALPNPWLYYLAA